MRLDTRDPGFNQFGARVFDLDTGATIPFVVWADEETGEYERYVQDAQGNFIMQENTSVSSPVPWRTYGFKTVRGQGRIRIVLPGEDAPVVVQGGGHGP